MTPQSHLPLRQKILLTLTFLTGIFIVAAYYTAILSWKTLYGAIFLYGICVPIALLVQDTLVDLDNNDIFKIWATIGLIFLIVYLLTRDNSTLIIRYSPSFMEREINKLLARSATKVLKALPLFLITYWVLNKLLKKKTGKYIVNTFKKHKWYNEAAQRNIYWFDILINLILFGAICTGLIEF
jgi:hypothetical protein